MEETTLKKQTEQLFSAFFARYPQCAPLRGEAERAAAAIAAVRLPNKVMTCGNGGSCADAGHIVGELMKTFRLRRAAEAAPPFPALEEAIPAVELGGSGALATAVQNDIGAEWVFAQQVYGLGTAGDVLIALSTSGNSQNVLRAAETARAKGIFTVAFTGRGGGKLSACCDVLLNVPAEETFAVQELHLPLYHLLCAAAESERWG